MFKKKQLVVKVIGGGGGRSATITRIQSVKRGVVYLEDATKPDDVNAFNATTGHAMVNYISGFTSYLIPFDDGETDKLEDLY